MKRFFFFALLLIVGLWMFFGIEPETSAQSQPLEDRMEFDVIDEVQIRTEYYTVTDGDTFTSAMDAMGISYADALAIVDAASEIFDFTRINTGKTFRLVYENDERSRLEYEPDSEIIVAVDLMNNFYTWEEEIEYEITYAQADVRITHSLFANGIDAGLSEPLLLDFVDIFAWEIDFATQVQEGDSFTILYEQRYRDGEEAGIGDVIHGQFTNLGETSYAYRYVNPEGEIAYYNEAGDSLVRPFLKAPLNYRRISSGYTNARFHPVLQSTMPHRAIDYAAAYGTPIRAVADGTVTYAGWNGGYGNYIDIRHNGVYETQYAHLSAIEVEAYEKVKQGQVIGYVGSTGFSTGPHLHYQVKVNGQLTDPLDVEFPKGDPIPEDQKNAFYEQKAEIDTQVK